MCILLLLHEKKIRDAVSDTAYHVILSYVVMLNELLSYLVVATGQECDNFIVTLIAPVDGRKDVFLLGRFFLADKCVETFHGGIVLLLAHINFVLGLRDFLVQ